MLPAWKGWDILLDMVYPVEQTTEAHEMQQAANMKKNTGTSSVTQETRDRDNKNIIHPWEDMGDLGENERTDAASG